MLHSSATFLQPWRRWGLHLLLLCTSIEVFSIETSRGGSKVNKPPSVQQKGISILQGPKRELFRNYLLTDMKGTRITTVLIDNNICFFEKWFAVTFLFNNYDEEHGQLAVFSSADPTRKRSSGQLLNFGSLLKQKSPIGNDQSSKDVMLPSSSFLGRSSGSLRQGAISGGREAFTPGNESDPARARILEVAPRVTHMSSGVQRNPQLGGSSDARQTPSGKNNSNSKNFESTLKGY